jgi:hypothetical protein
MRHSRALGDGWFNGSISNRLSPPHALQCHSNHEQGGAMIRGLESIARGKETTKRQKPGLTNVRKPLRPKGRTAKSQAGRNHLFALRAQ